VGLWRNTLAGFVLIQMGEYGDAPVQTVRKGVVGRQRNEDVVVLSIGGYRVRGAGWVYGWRGGGRGHLRHIKRRHQLEHRLVLRIDNSERSGALGGWRRRGRRNNIDGWNGLPLPVA